MTAFLATFTGRGQPTAFALVEAPDSEKAHQLANAYAVKNAQIYDLRVNSEANRALMDDLIRIDPLIWQEPKPGHRLCCSSLTRCSSTQCLEGNLCQEVMLSPKLITADSIAVADRYNLQLGWPPVGSKP